MRIALDAMGGDLAPGPIVAGAVEAVRDLPDLTVVLVGDEAQLDPLLAASPLPAGRVAAPGSNRIACDPAGPRGLASVA